MSMKKTNYIFTSLIIIALHQVTFAQAFRKGSFSISVSEGSTFGHYRTTDVGGNTPIVIGDNFEPGLRDPLIIQYGVSNKWSIGLSTGNDVFNVNPSKYYGFSTSNQTVKATTSELAFDVNYHLYVNKRLDMSVFASSGLFSIKIQGNDQDVFYKHESSGLILRYGTKVHYYFFKRLGAVGIISSYLASGSPKGIKDNNEAKTYNTTIKGVAIEAGLCYRLFR